MAKEKFRPKKMTQAEREEDWRKSKMAIIGKDWEKVVADLSFKPGTYPLPGSTLKPQNLQYRGEYGETQKEFEEQTFRNADHFTVVKFGTHNGSVAATFDSFARAVYEAHGDPRALVYAVTLEGRHFCIPHSEFPRYAEIWFEIQEGKNAQ